MFNLIGNTMTLNRMYIVGTLAKYSGKLERINTLVRARVGMT